jgi:hypothetical protein
MGVLIAVQGVGGALHAAPALDGGAMLLLEAAVVAAAGARLLTRPEQRVGAPH